MLKGEYHRFGANQKIRIDCDYQETLIQINLNQQTNYQIKLIFRIKYIMFHKTLNYVYQTIHI